MESIASWNISACQFTIHFGVSKQFLLVKFLIYCAFIRTFLITIISTLIVVIINSQNPVIILKHRLFRRIQFSCWNKQCPFGEFLLTCANISFNFQHYTFPSLFRHVRALSKRNREAIFSFITSANSKQYVPKIDEFSVGTPIVERQNSFCDCQSISVCSDVQKRECILAKPKKAQNVNFFRVRLFSLDFLLPRLKMVSLIIKF